MYLLDTNIFLELFLEQEKSNEVRALFNKLPVDLLKISDFSLYSIGILLFRQNKHAVFSQFMKDLSPGDLIECVRLEAEDYLNLAECAKKFQLDFDDAYQYTLAQKFCFKIISFDKDFDKTDSGRLLPSQMIKTIK